MGADTGTGSVVRGRYGSVYPSGTELGVRNWKLDLKTMSTRYVDTKLAKARKINQSEDETGSFEFTLKHDTNPYDSPYLIRSGTTMTAKFRVGGGTKFYEASEIFIDSVAVASEVEGNVTYSVQFTVTGTLTHPTGNIDSP